MVLSCDEKRARDLADAEAAGQFQRERDARIRRHDGMTGEKQQAELIVVNGRQFARATAAPRTVVRRWRMSRAIAGSLSAAILP